MIIVSVPNCTLEFWIRQAFYNYVVDCEFPDGILSEGGVSGFLRAGKPDRRISGWISFQVFAVVANVEKTIQRPKLATNN
jgi:hypothetical protein